MVAIRNRAKRRYSTRLIREIGERRDALHATHDGAVIKGMTNNVMGLIGERAFAERYGLDLDLSVTIRGDRGIDFRCPRATVDVKTSRRGDYLLVPVGRVHADVYVLAHLIGTDEARLLGWMDAATIKTLPTRDFGYGVRNHFVHARSLRSLVTLIDRLGCYREPYGFDPSTLNRTGS